MVWEGGTVVGGLGLKSDVSGGWSKSSRSYSSLAVEESMGDVCHDSGPIRGDWADDDCAHDISSVQL
jgi:hypothetical protein